MVTFLLLGVLFLAVLTLFFVFFSPSELIFGFCCPISFFFRFFFFFLFFFFFFVFFFSFWVFIHEHSRFIGQQLKEEDFSLTPLCHFHPLHRNSDVGRAITAENSPPHIASSRTQIGNFWFPSASC